MNEDAAPSGWRSVWEGVKVKRAILAGLAANAASFVVGGGFYVLIGRAFLPEPGSPFAAVLRWTPGRTFDMPGWWWVFLVAGNTVLAVGVAFVYAILYEGLPGRGVWKGVWFGLLIWLAALLPVAFTLAAIVDVSAKLAIVAAVEPLAEYTIYGAMTAAIYGEPRPSQAPAGSSPTVGDRRRRDVRGGG
jgi:hypothetical protein